MVPHVAQLVSMARIAPSPAKQVLAAARALLGSLQPGQEKHASALAAENWSG